MEQSALVHHSFLRRMACLEMETPAHGIASQRQFWEQRCFKTFLILIFAALLAGCSAQMKDDSRMKPLEASAFSIDRQLSRKPVFGTVARGQLRDDDILFTGKTGTNYSTHFPFKITREVFDRGQLSYEIHCAPCHDRAGEGVGMIVQRGFKRPLPFSDERLREAAPGYFFHVITDGFQTMYPMAAQISVEDRWAIVAYIRALQRSRHATLEDVPREKRAELKELNP